MTRNPVWLRVLFLLILLQALLLVSALGWPDLIAETLPWPASPLNARFIGTLYAMGAVCAGLSALAAHYVAVRVPLISVGTITGALLLLTLPHLGEFGADFPTRWVIFYTVDPLLVGLALWWLRGSDPAPKGRNPQAPLVLGYAGVLGLAGAVMLVVPELVVQVWPWVVTSILVQLYSAFLLTFALGAVLVARDPRWAAGWIWTTANLCMVVLALIVSVVNLDRFTAAISTWVWFGLLTAALVALSIMLRRGSRLAPDQLTGQVPAT